jgi:hypothetical protein
VINRSSGRGLTIGGGRNAVEGCYIGTDVQGAASLGNGWDGVGLYLAGSSRIGGTAPAQRNLISGNQSDGVAVLTSSANLIQGNLIGTDRSGTTALPNNAGVSVATDLALVASNNVIGGLESGAGNVLSGNDSSGVAVSGYIGASVRIVAGTRIQGNLIRFGQNGIGGAGGTGDITGNVITQNVGAGIFFDTFSFGAMPIRANSIFGNGGLGIDLAPAGVTPNDPGDGDTGPNRLQNFPVLTSAVSSGGFTTVTGTLNSVAGGTFTVELFESPAAHPTGYGEGATFRGAINVTTDAAGNAPISVVLPLAVPPGHMITATATDASGNTSEFSAARVVTP